MVDMGDMDAGDMMRDMDVGDMDVAGQATWKGELGLQKAQQQKQKKN